MAIVWEKKYYGQHYEVRTAGKSVRLYKDGVLHSQFNERQPITGQVWDLLTLPAFFYPKDSIQRILVMGVGGGTVIRQLNLFFQAQEIIGVDLDPIHLQVAKRFFGLNKQKNVTLHCDDAVAWLKEYQGPPFDMIIEDIFTEEQGEPVRAIKADKTWARCIMNNLSEQGLAVLNFTSGPEAKKSAFISQANIKSSLESCYLFACLRNVNVVGAFLKRKTTPKALRQTLNTFPALDQRKKTTPLQYRLLRIK